MPTSEARIAANRRNAQLSRGPKTPEGKARSRANAYKHGMTGQGIVLPPEEAAEVDRQAAEIRRTVAVPALARRVAVLACRLDRLALHEEAASGRRVREAVSDAEEERQAALDAWQASLDVEPRVAVRNLRRTAQGSDRLIGLWRELAGDLALGILWSDAHRDRAETLLGRRPGDLGVSRVGVLSAAARGDFGLLPPDPTAHEPGRLQARREQARTDLAALIAGEVDRLRAHQATLPALDPVAGLGEVADLALFDNSRQGELFRRYELATERGLYRALREVERSSSEATTEGELGSFGARPQGEPSTPEAGPPPAAPEAAAEAPTATVAAPVSPGAPEPGPGAIQAVAAPVRPAVSEPWTPHVPVMVRGGQAPRVPSTGPA